MELLVVIIVTVAAYASGAQTTKQPMTTPEEQCTRMCESGTVASSRWCKCLKRPMWSDDND